MSSDCPKHNQTRPEVKLNVVDCKRKHVFLFSPCYFSYCFNSFLLVHLHSSITLNTVVGLLNAYYWISVLGPLSSHGPLPTFRESGRDGEVVRLEGQGRLETHV